jgi:hypothetical protein
VDWLTSSGLLIIEMGNYVLLCITYYNNIWLLCIVCDVCGCILLGSLVGASFVRSEMCLLAISYCVLCVMMCVAVLFLTRLLLRSSNPRRCVY